MLLLAPFVLVFLLFFLVPALHTFYLSLTESSLTRTSAFVGLANYAQLLGHDPRFATSLKVTLYYSLIAVPGGQALALLAKAPDDLEMN